jgi:2-oxoglutarate ferredoxin oxidoreductase subunit delta
MASEKDKEPPENPEDSPDYWEKKTQLERQGKKLFRQVIYRDWCKACGICIAFCPTRVYDRDEEGKPITARPDDCTGCRFCELHCPDFAITIEECYPDRRRKEDK